MMMMIMKTIKQFLPKDFLWQTTDFCKVIGKIGQIVISAVLIMKRL